MAGKSLFRSRLRRAWPAGLRAPHSGITAAPLLPPAAIAELYVRDGACERETVGRRDIAHRLLGEQRSVYRGQGFDFEENRPYQPGDEPRFMNWRATARTGSFTMKVFREDRRPGVFLLVDRRSPMRFGTRTRLKAAQALRIAVLLAARAERRQSSIGGVVLEAEPRWLDEQPTPRGAFALIDAANTPCPPLPEPVEEPALTDVLRRLAVTLGRGTTIWLLSDFHDLDAHCEPALLQLAAEHDVATCQIVDAAEIHLPDAGRIAVPARSAPRILNSADARVREACAEQARAFLDERRQRLRDLGLPCIRVDSDVDAIESLLC